MQLVNAKRMQPKVAKIAVRSSKNRRVRKQLMEASNAAQAGKQDFIPQADPVLPLEELVENQTTLPATRNMVKPKPRFFKEEDIRLFL